MVGNVHFLFSRHQEGKDRNERPNQKNMPCSSIIEIKNRRKALRSVLTGKELKYHILTVI